MLLRNTNEAEINNVIYSGMHVSSIAHSLPDVMAMIADGSSGCVFFNPGLWNLVDLLQQLIKKYGTAKELIFSTYSITEFSARQIALLYIDGLINHIEIVLDSNAIKRYPNVSQLLYNIGTVKYSNIHAKITFLSFTSGFRLAIVGSANWTQNRRIESGVILFGKSAQEIADFLKSFKLK